MKHTQILIASVLLVLVAGTAGAAVVASDDFNSYNAGSLSGQGASGGGWDAGWAGSTNDITVITTGGLSYDAGGVTISGGDNAVQLVDDASGAIDLATRNLGTAQNGSDYYIRYLINWKAGSMGNQDRVTTSVNAYRDLGGGSKSNESTEAWAGFDWDNGIDKLIFGDTHQGSGTVPVYSDVDVVVGETYLLVMRYRKDPDGAYFNGTTYNTYNRYNRMDFWVNPDSTDTGETPDFSIEYPLTTVPKCDTFDGITFEAHSSLDVGSDVVLMDEYVIGTTWADVVPVPEPATMTLLALGSVAMLKRRRR